MTRSTAESESLAWRRLLRDPLAAATLALLTIAAAFYTVPLVSIEARSSITNWSNLPFLGLAVLALWLAKRRVTSDREQRFWRRLAVATALWLVAAAGLRPAAVEGVIWWQVVTDLLYVAFYVVVIVAAERRPDQPSAEPGRADPRLTWPGLVVFFLGLVIYFVLIPTSIATEEYESYLPSLFLYLAFDLYLVVRLVHFSNRAVTSRWSMIYRLLAMAFAGSFAADGVEAFASADLYWDVFWTGPLSLVWMLTPLLFVVASTYARLTPGSAQRSDEPLPLEFRRPGLHVVFLAVAFPVVHLLGYGLGIFEPSNHDPRETLVLYWTLLLGAMAAVQYRLLASRTKVLAEASIRAREELRLKEATLRLVEEGREARAALRASEDRFAKAFMFGPDPSAIVDVETRTLLEVNDAFLRLGGFEREDVVGRTGLELGIHGPEELARMDEALAGDARARDLDFEFQLPEGPRQFLLSIEPVELGQRPCFLMTGRDITERLEAQRTIAEQAALLDEAQDAIVVHDLQGRITFWNRGAERIYGWAAAEAIGRRPSDLPYEVPSPFLESAEEEFEARGEWIGELRQVARDGRPLTVESRWSLVRDELGHPTSRLVIATDVTEQRDLEQQFLRAQRMESLGTLAGGIAHDLNNVLAPILMSIQVLEQQIDDPTVGPLLEALEANARRGGEIVRQVLSFARGLEGQRVEIQARHVLKEIKTIVQETFPRGIDVTIEADRELWCVLGDPTQVHQVILNLCVNARDAMGGSGTLRVDAENVELDEAYCRLQLEANPGPHVRIRVSDTGSGIPSEHLDRVFEPFFTTKPTGQGTGLGLSTVSAIARGHGGFVTVYSELDRGTRFSVYLPAIRRSGGSTPVRGVAPLPQGRGELVLVVDDEEPVRVVATETLLAFGYRVESARDGREALERFDAMQGEIDVVVMDMMMPVMDGTAAIAAIRERDPDVPIIAASGLVARDTLAKIGFAKTPLDGQTVLPAILGPTSRFNAEGKHVVLKDRPKESRYIRTVRWRWKQWAGRYGNEEREDFRDIWRDCYQREFIPPPAIELTCVESEGRQLVVSPVFRNRPEEHEAADSDRCRTGIPI